jgi:hypothetical protein
MNKLIALLWTAFLLWGIWKIEDRQSKPASSTATVTHATSTCLTAAQKTTMPHLVARHDMGVNWLISLSDLYQSPGSAGLALGDFTGKYVGCKVSTNDAMVPSELKTRPDLSLATGKTLYLLPLQHGEKDWLNAGKHVDLFPGPTAAVSNAEVLAVICDSDCVAAVQLTPSEIEVLKLTNTPKLRIIAR